MTTREYLAAIIARHLDPVATRQSDPAGAIADAILAAGFKHPQDVAAQVEAALDELTEAIRLTVEYVGTDMLPAVEGWSWFDALKKYAPEKADRFVNPVPSVALEDLPTSGMPARTYTQEVGR